MNTILKIAAIGLLLLNGVGAIFGGWSLITDPTGISLQLSLDYLAHTPFRDYVIPGIILFLMNGILSIVVILTMLFNSPYAPKLITLQGLILLGWIVIQILMIQIVYWLHWLLGGTGIALILLGYLLSKREQMKKRR